jgi:hypothetical protein
MLTHTHNRDIVVPMVTKGPYHNHANYMQLIFKEIVEYLIYTETFLTMVMIHNRHLNDYHIST